MYGNLLVDVWDKCLVVLVGFFLFFTLAAEEFLVIGFIFSSQLCLQFRYLGAEMLKLSLALVSAVAAATSAAATTFLMHLPKLVPLHMGKLAVFIGPEIMFLNSAVFKLCIEWRSATWLASKSSFPAKCSVAFYTLRCATIIHAFSVTSWILESLSCQM